MPVTGTRKTLIEQSASWLSLGTRRNASAVRMQAAAADLLTTDTRRMRVRTDIHRTLDLDE